MKTISVSFAQKLINYAGRGQPDTVDSISQLHGAVAAYNMLVRNGVAYLADEVGMGKTYVALGVMGLLRQLKPDARVMVIAPRENIQLKWRKELQNFVRGNWLVEDNCMRALDGLPTHPPFMLSRLTELAMAPALGQHMDLFLRMTSFSTSVKTKEARDRLRKPLRALPWVKRRWLATKNPFEFRDRYARLLNLLLPQIDLLIIDEAHNLRKGFGAGHDVSNRNRVMGLMLGHPHEADPMLPAYGRRVKWILMLSATPFEYDFADLYRQLDVLGLAETRLRDGRGEDPQPVELLRDRDAPEQDLRALAGRMLVRRVRYLEVGGDELSKNLYRREWRAGGYETHDNPIKIEAPLERLVVGLIQKKVAEILADRRFNNAFQIGMLSSFESFLETMSKARRKSKPRANNDEADDDADVGIFDGRQTEDPVERQGIDTHSLEAVVRSYRRRFGTSLPHPKLDATVKLLDDVFDTGDKALVFVRRVATVYELKNRLDRTADRWIEQRMRDALPEMAQELNQVFESYREVSRALDPRSAAVTAGGRSTEPADEVSSLEEDTGGRDSFFSWFFRGTGPEGILSGAAFQKNRLASASAAAATMFEEDYVAWLLTRPDSPLVTLREHLGMSDQDLRAVLRERAWHIFRARTQQASYPKLYVVEAYQAAALKLLAEHGGDLGTRAAVVLHERFGVPREDEQPVPDGFPPASAAIGLTTFITELVKRPGLRAALWPDREGGDFRDRFRDRERRRELLSSMVRLGASYIDLYLVAMRQVGTLRPKGRESEVDEKLLAKDFLDLLDRQQSEGGFSAFHELHRAAEAFDILLGVNFPDAYRVSLAELPERYGRTLQRQVPVGGMSGGVNKQLVRQFRLPGFPLVLITTDVLQEGEDLHTFCRRVVHYGITWTPSAMEQRTGRIDRIGCLLERELNGRPEPPEGHELIQVFYPHLRDTVEVLQVRKVLERLNRFLQMVHEQVTVPEPVDSRIDVARESLRELAPVPRIEQKLQSAFPVRDDWLFGELGPEAVRSVDSTELERLFERIWGDLAQRYRIDDSPTGSERKRAGTVLLHDGRCVEYAKRVPDDGLRRQPVSLELKSQIAGDAVLVECRSPVGSVNLRSPDSVEELLDAVEDFDNVKLCARQDPRTQEHEVWVQGSRPFHRDTTQHEEVEELFVRVAEAADEIEDCLLERDVDPDPWLGRRDGGDDDS